MCVRERERESVCVCAREREGVCAMIVTLLNGRGNFDGGQEYPLFLSVFCQTNNFSLLNIIWEVNGFLFAMKT